jgi:Membrane bound O-acyl transferase family
MNHNVLLRELSEDRGFLASYYLSVCQKKLVAQTGETTETTSGRALEKTTGSKALFGWVPLVGLPVLAFSLQTRMKPWAFMWALAFAIYFGLKWLTWWRVKKPVRSGWRSVAYLFAFPGMDAESFVQKTKRAPAPRVREWLRAVFQVTVGVILLWIVAPKFTEAQSLLRGWTGMLGAIGIFQIAALIWKAFGIDAEPIMASPFRSRSLGEFWGKRWNLGFREVAHQLIFLPLRKYIGVECGAFVVFLASGVVHDLVISVPAGGGYGRPTAYFVFQGVAVLLERTPFGKHLGLGRGLRGWLFMALILTAPLFWLFHPPFVLRVIIPFMHEIRAL